MLCILTHLMHYYAKITPKKRLVVATFRKVGEKWRAEVCVKGKRKSKRFSATGRSKTVPKAAIEWAAEMEAVMVKSSGAQAGYILDDAFARYAVEISPQHEGERWEIVRIKKIRRDKISAISLMLLNIDDLHDWRDRSLDKISPASVSREMTIIMSVVRQCLKWQWIDSYPFDGAERPPKKRPRTRRVTEKEINLLCESVGMTIDKLRVDNKMQRVVIAFLIAVETGMRQGEICGLTVDDVGLSGRVARLAKTKNGMIKNKNNIVISNFMTKLNRQHNYLAQISCRI
ncbi:MAG: hypothetical protein DSY80_09505 [Desulfocapsa sp.]|nr:MAG: hypothetical protein DSY80_09505 [Desulfocapsa sp.]